jgi:hypothetical protein
MHIPEFKQGFAVVHRSIRCVHNVPVHTGVHIHETAFKPL